MPTKPPIRNWLALDIATPVTSEVTPAAKSTLLSAAVAYPQDAALGPYCGCARLFDGQTTGLRERYFAHVVAPGAVHARMGVVRSLESASTLDGALFSAWSTTGGTGVNDVVAHVPRDDLGSLFFYGGFAFNAYKNQITETGEKVNDAPAAPVDRQFELTTASAPYIEAMWVKNVAGCSLWVSEQVTDIETL